MPKTIEPLFKKIKDELPKSMKGFEGLEPLEKTSKQIGTSKFRKSVDALGGLFSKMGMASLASAGLEVVFNALEPLIEVFGAIIQIISSGIMETMLPAMQELIDVLLSDEMIEIWILIGETIGNFLGFIMSEISKLLSDPDIMRLLKTLIKIFENVVNIIMVILKPVFDILGKMSASQLGAVLYTVLVAMAFFKGLMEGTIYLAAAYGTLAAIALSPLLAMQEGGIVEKPTAALIGEAGPEAVIPLKGREDLLTERDEKMLWAMEDNNILLTEIRNELRTNNKITRLKGY